MIRARVAISRERESSLQYMSLRTSLLSGRIDNNIIAAAKTARMISLSAGYLFTCRNVGNLCVVPLRKMPIEEEKRYSGEDMHISLVINKEKK
jgi:hypothetical protein